MAIADSRVATADKIATLIRIYRSAIVSGDIQLRKASASELAIYGIRSADLAVDAKPNDWLEGSNTVATK